MSEIYTAYNQILSYFPMPLHGLVSLALALLLIYAVYKVVKSDFIFIILLVVLLPASVQIFNNIWTSLVSFIVYLLGHH